MKRFAVLLAFVLPVALLSSCYMLTSQSTGTIHLSFASAATRAITGQTADKVRVYLYSYASKANPPAYTLWTFPDTGLSYKEASFPGSIDVDVPKGYLWKVLVSGGTDGAAAGSFSTEWYGSSDVFPVVGPTSVSITNTTNSPFLDSPALMGVNLNGVRVVNSTVYASSSDTLYASTPAASPVSDLSQAPMPAASAAQGLKIQSLAYGYVYVNGTPTSELFLNTDQGIVPYNGAALDQSFSTTLTDKNGNRYTILQSGALYDSSGIAIFYQRDGGLGGILLNSDYPAPPTSSPTYNPWVDFDLASYNIAQKPVYDFALATNGTAIFAYFATKIGAFYTDSAQSLAPSMEGSNDLTTVANFFVAPNKGTIQALAVSQPLRTSGTLYIGTPDGAYSATLDGTTGAPTGFQAISPTAGDGIVKIAGNQYGYVAMRSKYNLYVYDPSVGQWKVYPFFAGLPGELHSMTWDDSTNTLYIAGSTGLVSLPLGPPPA